ncbi:MAG: PAS domain S-box protein [Cyanobacteriota bacterium]|nr:PAS domain S-box protein [Cyanobacteriota bacterium]
MNSASNPQFFKNPSSGEALQQTNQVDRPESESQGMEKNQRNYLEAMPHIVWLAGPTGEITYLNGRWQEYTGLTDASSLGWNFLFALHPEERQQVESQWHEAISIGNSYETQLRLRSSGGTYHQFIARVQPMKSDSGQIVEWLGTFTFAGKLQETEAPSQKDQQFIQALLDNISDGIVACDANGIITLFNPAAENFHGGPASAIPSPQRAEYYDFYLPDGKTPMPEEEIPLFRALRGETVRDVEMTIAPEGGTLRRLKASGNPIVGDSGEKLGAVVVMRDITSEKQAEAAMLESERRFRAIFDGAFQFIGLLQPDGILLELNQAALEFAGARPEEVIGRPVWETAAGQISEKTQQKLRQAVATAASGQFVRYEVEVVGADNRLISIDFSLKPVLGSDGRVALSIAEGRDITQRKEAEKELRRSEERWELILRGTGDGIFDWNILTGEAFMSERLKEMLGYKDEEMANNYEAWSELLHPDDVERVEQTLKDRLELKRPYILEYRLRCKDGSYKWILARGQAKWDETGQPIRMVGSHQDISARKQAEAEILRLNQDLEKRVARRTSELEAVNRSKDELLAREKAAREEAEAARGEIQLYKDIVQNMQVGLCVWHLESDPEPSFSLLTANPAATKLLSQNLDECRGLLLSECFPQAPENRKILLEAHAEVIRSQQPKELGEFYYTNAEDLESFFTIKIFPLPNSFVGMAIEDITERKWIEQALLESSQRYRLVVNNVKEVIFQIDINGCWNFLNSAWTEITGFTALESLNRSFVDFILAPEERQRCWELFQSLIEQKQEYFDCSFQVKTKKGSLRWLEMKAQINVNLQGVTIGVCGTINDTTERKQTEELLQARAVELTRVNHLLLRTTGQLKKRNQELDSFAYVTSHDLKAPLRAIANLSEWIEEDLDEALTEDTRYQMNLLRSRVHRMEGLINGLLQYSRIGRIKTEPERVDVNILLEDIIRYLEYPDEFTIEIEGEIPTLVTERVPLDQVFSNLISNSIKHHDRPDGRVKISGRDSGSFYEFTITDDGPGIEPKYHEKIFVIFQTLEARDKTENTGIGLSIVKKVVESRGGTISLESQLGRGTSFRFTWPK